VSAIAFVSALEEKGVLATVEEQGKLAVLVLRADIRLDADVRREIVALGRRHGFTNVCLELGTTDAVVSGD
jgi:hypothetical protein